MLLFLYRTIKFALQGFFRNIWLSIVTIIILVLTLFTITVVAGINVIAEKTIKSVQDKVDVSVYFKPDAQEQDVFAVRDKLGALSQVKQVTYVSKEEALAKFKAEHGDDPIILESIEQLEENPLSATLIVKAASIDEYPAILSVLDLPAYQESIQSKNFDDNQAVISRLSDLSNKLQRVGIIISVIFIVIAVLIIFNTIRINIYTHREEIGIMKLVGASNWFVRVPFLVESLFYAVLAVAVTIAILYPLMSVIAPQLNSFFEGYNLDLVSYVNSNLWQIIGWQLLLSTVLGVVSSGIAMSRYLKV